MSNVHVSYGEIETAAARLGQGREDITVRLQQLQQQIQVLISSGFVTDHASVRLGAAYDEYTAHTSGLISQLSDIQAFLTQSAAAMREMDAHLASRIG